MPEWLKLAGIAIVVIGLALRLRTTLVVVTAAIVTGLAAGLPLFSNEGVFAQLPQLAREGQPGIINMLGKELADTRFVTLFIITLPAVGLAERYGLQEQAAALIRRFRAATVGRLLIVYQLFRISHGMLGIRLNGHPAFVRPLVYPMSIGAAEANLEVKTAVAVPADAIEKIKAADASSENYGNFYGQNLSPVQAGILLVYGVMRGLGYEIGVLDLVRYTTPIVLASILLGALQFYWLDRNLLSAKRGVDV
jgi:uncharacterized membrane protein